MVEKSHSLLSLTLLSNLIGRSNARCVCVIHLKSLRDPHLPFPVYSLQAEASSWVSSAEYQRASAKSLCHVPTQVPVLSSCPRGGVPTQTGTSTSLNQIEAMVNFSSPQMRSPLPESQCAGARGALPEYPELSGAVLCLHAQNDPAKNSFSVRGVSVSRTPWRSFDSVSVSLSCLQEGPWSAEGIHGIKMTRGSALQGEVFYKPQRVARDKFCSAASVSPDQK